LTASRHVELAGRSEPPLPFPDSWVLRLEHVVGGDPDPPGMVAIIDHRAMLADPRSPAFFVALLAAEVYRGVIKVEGDP